MNFLGVNYRLIWAGRGYRTGLGDVIAYVLKPDDTLVGPFAMPESSIPGRYIFDFSSSNSDPEGRYIAILISPTERLQDTHPFVMVKRPGGFANVNVITQNGAARGKVSAPETTGRVDNSDISGKLSENEIDGKIAPDSLSGEIRPEGEING